MNRKETILQPEDHFEIGGDDLLATLREGEVLDDIRVRVGTLLKTETVSFLLGAGASVNCGGPLIGSIPLVVEQELHRIGITEADSAHVDRWLETLYLAARYVGGGSIVPVTTEAILERHHAFGNAEVEPLQVNFERVLAVLHRWRAALPAAGGQIQIEGIENNSPINVHSHHLDAALLHATRALARACALPTQDKADGLTTYKTFVRKLLTRPLNLKRVNVFTLNYDTLVEQACDAEGIVLLDGFVGTQRRVFRPESYEQDLYFPAETTEGRVHRFDRVLHLYKLHGSITWSATEPTIDNPYGVQWVACDPVRKERLLIYPTPAKYGETLGMPYSEMFRRFAAALVRPQSVLFVIGYGFGDEHVNAIITQAMAMPSFILVIVDPQPKSDFVTTLRKQRDRRIWISEGPTLGTLAGFVDHVLPDLRDEEIRRKVLATYRALTKTSTQQGDAADGE